MSALQRGSSHNPRIAQAQRIAQRAQANAEARAARRQTTREHGRMLDQIEHCYREYTPTQIHQADAMRECGDFTNVDEAFDAGQIEWRDDCLAIVGS